jgi:oligopeptide transport system permease protein
MGTVVVVAIFVLLFNLVVDILYALLDPRVRLD